MFVENPLNGSELIFPTLEVFHILGFTVALGTIFMVDFRVLGWGMRRQAVADLAKDLAPWTLVGLALVLLSGPIMFSSDPDMYYLNRSFQVKMACLLVAIIFNYTVHRRMARAGAVTAGSKLVAFLSLVLWVGVVAGGIFIAFTT
jgi:hypothetical protein